MKKIVDVLNENNINGFVGNWGTDKASDHSYDIIYDELFYQFKDKEISLLEIGVQYGGSSLLWHEFFPKSKLVLIDIFDQVPENIWKKMNKNRYDYKICDAFAENTLNDLKKNYPNGFDIIIEDGPHTLESQLFTIKNYTKLLKKGGILVIEDIQKFENCKTIMSSIGDVEYERCELMDVRHVKGRYDDLMVIVKK